MNETRIHLILAAFARYLRVEPDVLRELLAPLFLSMDDIADPHVQLQWRGNVDTHGVPGIDLQWNAGRPQRVEIPVRVRLAWVSGFPMFYSSSASVGNKYRKLAMDEVEGLLNLSIEQPYPDFTQTPLIERLLFRQVCEPHDHLMRVHTNGEWRSLLAATNPHVEHFYAHDGFGMLLSFDSSQL